MKGDRSIPIDQLLEPLQAHMRYRWCGPSFPRPCECQGCATRTGRLEEHGYTEADWVEWVRNHPRKRGR